ncbi:Uncharacterised protein [Chlamydia abortus]|nr:Uncharacterised protein [Chlamydia abortus]
MTITPETLRIIRQVYRLTLGDMAALLDTSVAGVWRIEQGERAMSPEMVSALKREFDLSPEKLARIFQIYEETGGRPSKRVRVLTV